MKSRIARSHCVYVRYVVARHGVSDILSHLARLVSHRLECMVNMKHIRALAN